MFKKINLNDQVNDKETLREFIKNSENEFEMESVELELMSDLEFDEYVNFLDYLWTK